jgi:hypothetical protein
MGGMATKERVIQLIDSLPDTPETELRLDSVVHELEPNGAGDEWGEPEMLPIPQDWGWGRLPSGRPAPNWVAGLDEVRRGH